MTLLLKILCLCLMIIAPVGTANADDDFDERIKHYKKQISAVQEEMNEIRDMRKFIRYMDERGTYYQEVACKSEKRIKDNLKKEYNKIPEYYDDKRNEARERANKALKKWQNCVDAQIARNPEFREMGIRNYNALFQTYTKWNQDFHDKRSPARFHELVREKQRLERNLRQQQRAKQALDESRK